MESIFSFVLEIHNSWIEIENRFINLIKEKPEN